MNALRKNIYKIMPTVDVLWWNEVVNLNVNFTLGIELYSFITTTTKKKVLLVGHGFIAMDCLKEYY